MTTDKCKTWHMLSNDIVTRVYWGVKGIDPENTIHMEVQDLASGMYARCCYVLVFGCIVYVMSVY